MWNQSYINSTLCPFWSEATDQVINPRVRSSYHHFLSLSFNPIASHLAIDLKMPVREQRTRLDVTSIRTWLVMFRLNRASTRLHLEVGSAITVLVTSKSKTLSIRLRKNCFHFLQWNPVVPRNVVLWSPSFHVESEKTRAAVRVGLRRKRGDETAPLSYPKSPRYIKHVVVFAAEGSKK